MSVLLAENKNPAPLDAGAIVILFFDGFQVLGSSAHGFNSRAVKQPCCEAEDRDEEPVQEC